jgi:hypothetical protein
MIALGVGSALVVAILVRYSKSKKRFTDWSPPNDSQSTGGLSSVTEGSSANRGGGAKRLAPRKQSLHDRWLMVRFFVAFIILA